MYPVTTSRVIELLEEKYESELRPHEYDEEVWHIEAAMASHLFWMCQKIQTMTDREKAGRWIGWVTAVMERELHLMRNSETRKLMREDVHS